MAMAFDSVLWSVLFSQPYQQSAGWDYKPSKYDFSNLVKSNIAKLTYKMFDDLVCMQIQESKMATDFLSLRVIYYTNDN